MKKRGPVRRGRGLRPNHPRQSPSQAPRLLLNRPCRCLIPKHHHQHPSLSPMAKGDGSETKPNPRGKVGRGGGTHGKRIHGKGPTPRGDQTPQIFIGMVERDNPMLQFLHGMV